jgi:hypothetical protein
MQMETSESVGWQVQKALPAGGLFANQKWHVALRPFPIPKPLFKQLQDFGRIYLQFYKASNLLHRFSREGRAPEFVAKWLNAGKPESLLALQAAHRFKNDLPRVIRPDLLLTETGFVISELDSVPGGIGLTAWLNQTYAAITPALPPIGGSREMLDGFAGIFPITAPEVFIIVSEEAAAYRPEMEWLAAQLGSRFRVVSQDFTNFPDGSAVYRFFELFDIHNIPAAETLLQRAGESIFLTPPPKPVFEEKLLFALLWNRNLREFWRRELGETFTRRLQEHVPFTWALDPTPLPPHGAIPHLELTGWQQLKILSQRERELILKISGYSEKAWGARGVYLGSDLSQADWSNAVDEGLDHFSRGPYVLQKYHRPKLFPVEYLDTESGAEKTMHGRVRLCPYYFVHGNGEESRAHLCGVLATICPGDKKIIHGMRDAVLAPCTVEE